MTILKFPLSRVRLCAEPHDSANAWTCPVCGQVCFTYARKVSNIVRIVGQAAVTRHIKAEHGSGDDNFH